MERGVTERRRCDKRAAETRSETEWDVEERQDGMIFYFREALQKGVTIGIFFVRAEWSFPYATRYLACYAIPFLYP